MESQIVHKTFLLDSLLFVSPQPYQDPVRVRDDCTELFAHFQYLIPVSGHSQTRIPLVFLAGTIPIMWRGVQYNIPVIMQIPETYPKKSPMVVVNPTPEMTIVSQHPNVDSYGNCHVPYLSGWNSSCRLVELVSALQHCFTQKPPVRSTVQSPTCPPPPYGSSNSVQPASSNLVVPKPPPYRPLADGQTPNGPPYTNSTYSSPNLSFHQKPIIYVYGNSSYEEQRSREEKVLEDTKLRNLRALLEERLHEKLTLLRAETESLESDRRFEELNRTLLEQKEKLFLEKYKQDEILGTITYEHEYLKSTCHLVLSELEPIDEVSQFHLLTEPKDELSKQ
eukprot:TRINITY_DN2426_c0_g1_i25.p1 TRINITY_DN2426_c0_g1~~TRINITY_DN2426_c0_g1_i25.p1  ORF type:complete len:336 (-),score=53.73 TRINITY_DN2426_c0_g1_i25:713-1720(-)